MMGEEVLTMIGIKPLSKFSRNIIKGEIWALTTRCDYGVSLVLFIWGWSEISWVRVLSIWRYRGGWMKILRDPCSSFQHLQWRGLGYLVFFVILPLYYHKITITLRSNVVVLSVTRSCGYPRGDVRLILDGWLVEEYRVLRDSMLHELSTPLSVTH